MGILLPTLVTVGLMFGAGGFTSSYREYTPPLLPALLIILTAVPLAFLFSSRISPVASLIAGLGYTLLGLIPVLEFSLKTALVPLNALPVDIARGYSTVAYSGMLLLLGATLLVASAFPSRWRSPRPARHAAPYPPPPGYGPPPPRQQQPPQGSMFQPQPPRPSGPPATGGQEDVTRPMHRD
ncbi:hypothetical protein [Nonomuraea longicatena]|uniref:hypothetical protein n=1 Tax=Nonomuraea longicatena TaxID=83682 RepID=UPI0031D4624A